MRAPLQVGGATGPRDLLTAGPAVSAVLWCRDANRAGALIALRLSRDMRDAQARFAVRFFRKGRVTLGGKGTKAKPATVSRRRVGDEERHQAAELLSEHHAHGRLTQEEFEDRLGAALTAQTTAELGRLLADLPIRAPDDGTDGGDTKDDDRVPAKKERRMVVEVDLRIFRKPLVLTLSTGAVVATSAWLAAADNSQGYQIPAGLIGMAIGMVTVPLLRRRKRKDD